MNEILDWLHLKRRKWPANDSYWDLKFKIHTNPKLIDTLEADIQNAKHIFSSAKKIRKPNNQTSIIWDAKDSIALKYLARDILDKYNFNKYCYSNKYHGGVPRARKVLTKLLETHKYIYRSDIYKFYNSIDHEILLSRIRRFTTSNQFKLIARHLDRIQWQDGNYVEIQKGISKSSPLSPVLGCIYLNELDQAMQRLNVKYLRYADDWIILAQSKPMLRKAAKITKQILNKLKLEEHPDKTDYRNLNNPNSRPFIFLGQEFNLNKKVINITKRINNN
ncbi:reverse transcriptase domain-containing protein [Francisella sp. SYW-9]|uniref:reverse transcriptase domain-containing protein n=1 Tax=Francisella sp. SYW-9 TaxID=2610888 RepID=UPI00123D9277|nr:reverse transcriptase domain-containing protein [Francisella sp. SYW-9]